MQPTHYAALSAHSHRPEIQARLALLIREGRVRVEPMPGDHTRVRVVPITKVPAREPDAMLDDVLPGLSNLAIAI